MVSKEQYDALLAKYEALQNQSKTGGTSFSEMAKNDKMLMDKLNSVKSNQGVAETVDVFGGPQAQSVSASNMQMEMVSKNFVSDISDSDFVKLENEAFDLKKGEQMMNAGQFNDAMAIFNSLRQSSYRQISVRAQFNIGEILYAQNEFDLAMQAFEDIIGSHAFSGVVLKTLGRLIACANKLNLKEKQDQYYSILHDFFESA